MLTIERLKEVLDYCPTTGEFRWKINKRGPARAGSLAGSLDPRGYRRVAIDQKFYYAHRLAWFCAHGEMPELVDHVNLNKSDNRLANLRVADKAQNAANASGIRSSSKGVYLRKGKWLAVAGKKHIGTFTTYEAAVEAYGMQAKKLYGDFARA